MAEPIVRCRPLLGTFVEVRSDSVRAVNAAFAAMARVHALMSAHDPESELSRINCSAHQEPVAVNPWTAAVLQRAKHWARLSDGAFDPVVAGRNALEIGLLPRHPSMHVGGNACWQAIQIDDCSVKLDQPACIDLGGIAKGFAVDCAIDALRKAGADYGLVNAGGDLAGYGNRPWQVDVVEPAGRLSLASVKICNEALATSALQSGAEGLSADHLVAADPRWTSATVLAPSAMDADALTKVILSGSTAAPACLASVSARAVTIDRAGRVQEVEPGFSAAMAEAA